MDPIIVSSFCSRGSLDRAYSRIALRSSGILFTNWPPPFGQSRVGDDAETPLPRSTLSFSTPFDLISCPCDIPVECA